MFVSAILGFLDPASSVDTACATQQYMDNFRGPTHTDAWSIGVTASKFGLRCCSFPSKCMVPIAILDVQ